MTVTAADFIHLPYTADLTRAGILYACQSLAQAQRQIKVNPIHALRTLVVTAAVDVAFRRYLSQQGVPYQTLNVTPFSQPGHSEIILEKRRCVFICALSAGTAEGRPSREQVSALALKQARVPAAYLNTESHFDPELFLFAFVFHLPTFTRLDPRHPPKIDQPHYLLYPMSTLWARPRRWRSLGSLVLEVDAPRPITLDIGGLGEDRRYFSRTLQLQPHQPLDLHLGLYTLAYLALPTYLNGRIQIYSSGLRRRYSPSPDRWGNLWIQGSEIILVGYMSRGEFRQRAFTLHRGNQPWPAEAHTLKDRAIPVSALHPLRDLFQQTNP